MVPNFEPEVIDVALQSFYTEKTISSPWFGTYMIYTEAAE